MRTLNTVPFNFRVRRPQNLYVFEDVMASALNLPSLLKFPDDVKVVLEATFVTTVESESRRDPQNRRILAVVSHKDEWDLTEEGA